MRTLFVLIAAVALPALAPGVAAAQTPKPLGVTVGDNFFKPKSKTVPPKTKVTWTWKGAVEHNLTLVTAPKGIKKSKYTVGDRTRGAVSRTLSSTGKWFFVCTLHAGMEQTIKIAVPKRSSSPY